MSAPVVCVVQQWPAHGTVHGVDERPRVVGEVAKLRNQDLLPRLDRLAPPGAEVLHQRAPIEHLELGDTLDALALESLERVPT